ncbi:hypothetical protein GCM10023191_029600 [Actinoallomurus oryzae]|uniref:Uncharacterized protein n=1 Tax=Actinoallomurus oryzae TaxID=502180 RepID=A0ABP8PTL3_9ACTN
MSKSALAAAAAGYQLPTERVVHEFVRVCDGDWLKWRQRRLQANTELDARTGDASGDPPGGEGPVPDESPVRDAPDVDGPETPVVTAPARADRTDPEDGEHRRDREGRKDREDVPAATGSVLPAGRPADPGPWWDRSRRHVGPIVGVAVAVTGGWLLRAWLRSMEASTGPTE